LHQKGVICPKIKLISGDLPAFHALRHAYIYSQTYCGGGGFDLIGANQITATLNRLLPEPEERIDITDNLGEALQDPQAKVLRCGADLLCRSANGSVQ
jgi:hypothetical protein